MRGGLRLGDRRMGELAKLPIPVLLTGPTGSGKTFLASSLHRMSGRHGEFVQVDCTQLLPERLVADLFGAQAGSYTGLGRDRMGLVEKAAHGTLLLDEVGDLSCRSQAMILTFLDRMEYRRLGDHRVRAARDVRLISATNRDLESLVRSGRFREDLYYRLAGFTFVVRGLDERKHEIGSIAKVLLDEVVRRTGGQVLDFSPAALEALVFKDWPGNIRQLRHVVRSCAVLARLDQSDEITLAYVQDVLGHPCAEGPARELASATELFRQRHVMAAVAATDGNRAAAARALGISRSTLYTILSTGSESTARM